MGNVVLRRNGDGKLGQCFSACWFSIVVKQTCNTKKAPTEVRQRLFKPQKTKSLKLMLGLFMSWAFEWAKIGKMYR